MADRFPLILNTSTNQIQEIPSGDSLDLTGSGIANAGIITAGNVTIGAATTDLVVTGDARITGILTIGTGSLTLDGSNNLVNVGTALTLGHTQGLQFHTQNLHSAGFEVNQINVSGVATAATFKGDGDFVELDVDGHTNLDNVSITGVTTISGAAPNLLFTETDANPDWGILCSAGQMKFQDVTATANILTLDSNRIQAVKNLDALAGLDVTGNATVSGNLSVGGVLTYEDVTNVDSVGLITARNGITVSSGTATFQGAIDANGDLDVDGHTNLDNVSIAGVSTFTGAVTTGDHITLSGQNPRITFTDTNHNPDFEIYGSAGNFKIWDSTNAIGRLVVNSDGHIDIPGNLDCGAGIDVTGGVTATGTVKGATCIVGSGNDFQVTRSSGNTEIQNYSGTLLFSNASSNLNNVLIRARADENSIMCIPDGAVELYHNNAKKFATTQTGAVITGIATATTFSGSGASLTNLNGSNIASGTIPVARIGTGTKSASTFYRGDGTFQVISTDLVNDSSPQLGGDLDVNNFDIKNGNTIYEIVANTRHNFKCAGSTIMNINAGGVDFSAGHNTHSDNVENRHGTHNDIRIYHSGSHSYVKNTTDYTLWIQNNDSQSVIVSNNSGTNKSASFNIGAAAELYHANSKRFETTSSGTHHTGFTHTFGTSGAVPTLKAGGSNTDIRLEAVGAGGWIEFMTTGTARWRINGTHGHFYPHVNNTYDIGTSTYRVRNIYTNDLHLSNEGHSNDVDGTWGNYTIQEGESDLFLINKRSGKKYKFNLTEVS